MDTNEIIPQNLLSLRTSIDNLDAALIYILSERFRCTRIVGALKARHNFPPVDHSREKKQVKRIRSLAVEAGLDPEFAEKILNLIIEEVVSHHKKIAALTNMSNYL